MEWSGRAPLSSRRVTPGWGYERSTVMSNKSDSTVTTIGIDIGKNSFHVVGLDRRGAIVLRQKWSRGQIEGRLANMPPCLGPIVTHGAFSQRTPPHRSPRSLQLRRGSTRRIPVPVRAGRACRRSGGESETGDRPCCRAYRRCPQPAV
jgi:hypothetical protein